MATEQQTIKTHSLPELLVCKILDVKSYNTTTGNCNSVVTSQQASGHGRAEWPWGPK